MKKGLNMQVMENFIVVCLAAGVIVAIVATTLSIIFDIGEPDDSDLDS